MSEIMDELAARIAAELTGTWRVWRSGDGMFSGVELVNDDGWRLSLRALANKPGKVTITGILPKSDYTGGPRPSVTVTAARSPKQIAGEISRRMLPEYERMHSAVLAYNAWMSGEQDAELALAKTLLDLRPGPDAWLRSERRHSGSVRVGHAVLWNGWTRRASGEARVADGGKTVELVLRDVPAGLAKEIVRQVAAWKTEERSP